MKRLSALVATLVLTTGCMATANNVTINRVLDRGMRVPDLGMVCHTGAGMRHTIAGLTSPKRPADQALIAAEASAALCAEIEGMDLELDRLRVRSNMMSLGEPAIAMVKDIEIAENRAHTEAAARFWRSFQHLESQYGPVGEGDCPRISKRDELVYFLGLYSGMEAVLHDKAGGGEIGVPLDTVGRVGRAAECLDDDTWFNVPKALTASAWAIIPGSGPDDVDPWVMLEEQAEKGGASGVRLARALQIKVAGNSSKDDAVHDGIVAMRKSLDTVPQSETHAFFDAYSARVALHESDLLWMKEEGHRTPMLGEFPAEPEPEMEGGDPFGGSDDPFGADPFGGGGETEDAEGEETEGEPAEE